MNKRNNFVIQIDDENEKRIEREKEQNRKDGEMKTKSEDYRRYSLRPRKTPRRYSE